MPDKGRFVPVVLNRQVRQVVSKSDIALDRLNRGIMMPSVLRMLQDIENMDDMVSMIPQNQSED